MSIVKLNNNGVKNATAFGSGVTSLGSMVFIKKLTASSSSTLSFVDGASSVVLDNTYKEYLFTFNNMHPATDQANLTFQADTGTNTSYNQTVTSTYFRANHTEDDSSANLSYDANRDQAQGSNFIEFMSGLTDDNDSGSSGMIHLFNPSSDTFVKHFTAVCNCHHHNPSTNVSRNIFIAGYFNTTTALTRVQFKMSSGNIDAGDICLYGIA